MTSRGNISWNIDELLNGRIRPASPELRSILASLKWSSWTGYLNLNCVPRGWRPRQGIHAPALGSELGAALRPWTLPSTALGHLQCDLSKPPRHSILSCKMRIIITILSMLREYPINRICQVFSTCEMLATVNKVFLVSLFLAAASTTSPVRPRLRLCVRLEAFPLGPTLISLLRSESTQGV